MLKWVEDCCEICWGRVGYLWELIAIWARGWNLCQGVLNGKASAKKVDWLVFFSWSKWRRRAYPSTSPITCPWHGRTALWICDNRFQESNQGDWAHYLRCSWTWNSSKVENLQRKRRKRWRRKFLKRRCLRRGCLKRRCLRRRNCSNNCCY